MTGSVISLVILLASSALAQVAPGNIDMSPSGVTANLGPGYSIATVSAADLSIPRRARVELQKANQLTAKGQLQKALQRLNRALAIDPDFAGAYNNLGVIYSLIGDSVNERKALERAVQLDDHCALAYLNLGRLQVASANYPGADLALRKASSLNPADPVSLILLSYSQLLQKHFDDAIATSQRAHALGKPHAFAHHLAARAFEGERQFTRAIAELKRCLEEEPTGSRADDARRELEIVQNLQPAQ